MKQNKVNSSENKRKHYGSYALKISSCVDRAFHSSLFYHFFRSHYKTEKRFSDGFFRNMLYSEKIGGGIRIFKNTFAKSSETSIIVNEIKKFYRGILFCSIHGYAVIMLYFGIYALAISAIKTALFGNYEILPGNAYWSVIMIIISFILLPVRSSLSEFVRNSRILSFISECFFVTGNHSLKNDVSEIKISNGVYILTGTFLGFLTFFFSIGDLLIAIFVMFLVLLSFKTPENSLPVLIISSPFLSETSLIVFCFFAFCAYLFKVMRGKRSFNVRFFDLLILLSVVIIIFGGFNSTNRMGFSHDSVFIASISLIYFIIRNCVKSENLCRKCIRAILVCSVTMSFMILYQRIFNIDYDNVIIEFVKSHINIYEFSSSEKIASGEFLLILLPFAIMAQIISNTYTAKFLSAISIIICTIAIVAIGSKGLMMAFAVCILLYITSSFKNPFISVITVILIYAVLSVFISNSSFLGNDRFFNINDYKENILLTASKIASDNFIAGIGIGKDNFSKILRMYMNFGNNSISSCYNIYLQIFVQTGFFGFMFFICAFINYLKIQFSCLSENRVKSIFASLVAISSISFASVIAFRGLTSEILSNPKTLFVFFVVLGISSATYYSFENNNLSYNED